MASDEYSSLKRDIIECLRNQDQSLSVFRKLITGKDTVIFVGNTRSGKSTLVNYTIDNQLEGWESGKMEYKIRLKEGDGPDIGQGSLSCTTVPGVYRMRGAANYVVVDLPGFEDNRGIVQDIINALCISQIIHARTVKFVLVFDINEITNDNIRNFSNTLNQVQDLVRNFDKLKNSFCAVFTKDWRNFTQEEIVTILQNKVLNQPQMDMDKTLVKNLVDNKNFIGIFKMPSKEGDISTEIDMNIKGAINKCHEVDVEKCEIKFAFSDKAQEALLQIYPEYTDTNYFKEETDKIIATYDDHFKVDKFVYASYDNELDTAKAGLEKISEKIKKHQDAERTQLYEIQHSIDTLLDLPSSSEFKTNFKFVIMLDTSSMLEEKYKNMIMTNYFNTLKNLSESIDKHLGKIEAELQERKKEKIGFSAAGVSGVLAMFPALVGAAKSVEGAFKTGDTVRKIISPGVAAFGAGEAAFGATATTGICMGGALVVGAGGASVYVLYKQTYGKRIKARQAQNRNL